MMSDVPWGVLLSGGLDSSLVASVAQRTLTRKSQGEGASSWMSKLHSFSVGLKGSPDLEAAQKAADHIGTQHHPYTFTLQEGLGCRRGGRPPPRDLRRHDHQSGDAHVPHVAKIKAMGSRWS